MTERCRLQLVATLIITPIPLTPLAWQKTLLEQEHDAPDEKIYRRGLSYWPVKIFPKRAGLMG
jgi:hypothetical protein